MLEPLDKVIAEAHRAVVAPFARRTALRLGLPQQTMRNPAPTHLLLFFCRHRVPILSAMVRMLFNSEIQCRLPASIHLPYPYGIVIHPRAVIGQRVTLMQQVMIGGKDSSEDIAPVIGDDVCIGAGARVLGDVRIGNAAVIGANAVVTRDIPPGVTVVGANRILPGARPASVGAGRDPAIARFPVGAQRQSRSQTRQPL
jgi:hypothetical protein